jgi:two-component system sensor histidine kinase/response regulator
MAYAGKVEASTAEPWPSARTVGVKPNILIVDDRRENLIATEKVLKSIGVSIFKATSGNEALSLILRQHFAVVLLDVQMPEMDGFETAMLMQEHDSMQGVPIIFVTAISKEDQYATRAAEIGAVDYIFKPINPDILKSKVKVYVDLYVQREEILNLNAHLKQYNEELERFAYICSHDMQEPVRMMSSYAGLLSVNYESMLDGRGQKYLRLIDENAKCMQKMIQDILSFSRVGREAITIDTLDCNQIARETLARFEGIIQEKGARVTCGNLPILRANETLFRVLLQNLIGNALKFQDGSKTPEVEIGVERQSNCWRFSVRDNGIGINADFRDRVFTIFQRGHRKEDYPGTGIGLSTCSKFIRLYGGEIQFDSVPGGGTVFFFTLPYNADATLPASPSQR